MSETYAHFLSPVTVRGKPRRNRAEYILGETDISPTGSRAPGDHYFELRGALFTCTSVPGIRRIRLLQPDGVNEAQYRFFADRPGNRCLF